MVRTTKAASKPAAKSSAQTGGTSTKKASKSAVTEEVVVKKTTSKAPVKTAKKAAEPVEEKVAPAKKTAKKAVVEVETPAPKAKARKVEIAPVEEPAPKARTTAKAGRGVKPAPAEMPSVPSLFEDAPVAEVAPVEASSKKKAAAVAVETPSSPVKSAPNLHASAPLVAKNKAEETSQKLSAEEKILKAVSEVEGLVHRKVAASPAAALADTPAVSEPVDAPEVRPSWAQLKPSAKLLDVLAESQWPAPNSLQEQLLEAVATPKDVLVLTRASGELQNLVSLLVAEKLLSEVVARAATPTKAKVIVVTRDFRRGQQIQRAAQGFLQSAGLSILFTEENREFDKAIETLKTQPIDVVVGSARSLQVLAKQNALDCTEVQLVVWDDYDRLLESWQSKDFEGLDALFPKEGLQQAILSSRVGPAWRESVFLRLNTPVVVSDLKADLSRMQVGAFAVASEEKFKVLLGILMSSVVKAPLICCNTDAVARWVGYKLSKNGHTIECLTTLPSPEKRKELCQGLAEGKVRAVVCTDATSKSFGCVATNCVIHFDVPKTPADFNERNMKVSWAQQPLVPVLVCEDYGAFLDGIQEKSGVKIPVDSVPDEFLNLEDNSDWPLLENGEIKPFPTFLNPNLAAPSVAPVPDSDVEDAAEAHGIPVEAAPAAEPTERRHGPRRDFERKAHRHGERRPHGQEEAPRFESHQFRPDDSAAPARLSPEQPVVYTHSGLDALGDLPEAPLTAATDAPETPASSARGPRPDRFDRNRSRDRRSFRPDRPASAADTAETPEASLPAMDAAPVREALPHRERPSQGPAGRHSHASPAPRGERPPRQEPSQRPGRPVRDGRPAAESAPRSPRSDDRAQEAIETALSAARAARAAKQASEKARALQRAQDTRKPPVTLAEVAEAILPPPVASAVRVVQESVFETVEKNMPGFAKLLSRFGFSGRNK